MGAVRDAISLTSYRSRVAEIYSDVRAVGCSQGSWSAWRADRDRLLADHPMSPVVLANRPGFDGAPFFAYDPTWCLVAKLDTTTGAAVDRDGVTPLSHSGAGTTPYSCVGDVVFERAGVEMRLGVWWIEEYSGGLFVPFRDATCGVQTYGGGRYLLDTAKGADLGGAGVDAAGADLLWLDFNFAYHPSCAWDPRWSCPLAPGANHLEVEVAVGEMDPVG